jgi:hypothetical protein
MQIRFFFINWRAVLGVTFVFAVLLLLLLRALGFFTESDHYLGYSKASPETLESAERAKNGEVLVIHSDGKREWVKTVRGVEAAEKFEEMKAEIQKQVKESK